MNKKVDEEYGSGGTQENGKIWKLRRFSRNEFWKNIGCLLTAHTFGLGGSILWEKDPKISGKKRKRSSIQSKIDFYEVCALLFQNIYYCYYLYTNHFPPSTRFVASITLGESSLEGIGQESSSPRDTRRKIND